MATKKIIQKKKPMPPMKQGVHENSHSAAVSKEKSNLQSGSKKSNEFLKAKAELLRKPLMQKVSPMKQSKKTAYDVKEASNPKLTASARKNYADNAEAAMKQMKPKASAAKMKKC